MKESWGHPGVAVSEVEKQETEEEVKSVMKQNSWPGQTLYHPAWSLLAET